ncbi:NUC173 domain-containing protein [Dichotomocladium elegans]|nr:NUC173 domain-containing protein [Dichotomocladium elegans]
MSTLQATGADNEITGALVYLLADVLPSLPQAVHRSKFDDVMQILEVIYERHKEEQPIVRSVIGCLQELLANQDAHTWTMPMAKKAFQLVLLLSVNTSAKARKAAHDAIRAILSRPPPPLVQHPAASTTADFILRILHETTKNDQHAAQQALSLLQSIVVYWPTNRFSVLCQTLLQLPKFNNIFLTKGAFEVFEALFDGQENDIEDDKFAALLKSIYDIKPAAIDDRLLPAWLLIISKAYPAYAKINPGQCGVDLPVVFSTIFNDFQQESRSYQQIANCLSTLVEYCITNEMIAEASKGHNNGLTQIVKHAESGLGVHYQAAWVQVMSVQQSLFKRLHRASSPLMNGCVALLGELRLSPAESYKEQLDKTLGAAIAHMGAEHFLNILPLNLENSSNSVGRAFLLPLLKIYVSNTNLGYFVNVLMPLADRLAEKSSAAAAKELELQAKVYQTLVNQIWSLVPKFCDLPLDLRTAFSETVAERFSSILYTQPDLRPTVSQALQNLIDKNQTLAKSAASDEDLVAVYGVSKTQAVENLHYMGKFAVNYLAVLFNVYSQIGTAFRGFLNEVIKSFLSVASTEDINVTFKKVIGLLSQALESPAPPAAVSNDPTIPAPMSHTMLDLSIIMIPFLDPESAQLLYNGTVTSLIGKEGEPTLQKKGYRILSNLMECPNGRSIISQQIADLEEKILEATPSCSVAARKNRVNALRGVVKLLPPTDLHFIPAILSEAVISSKDASEKTRENAFALLVEMGEKMKEGGIVRNSKVQGFEADAPDAAATIGEYFMMVTAGLAGTTAHMISATIVALSRIFFEFKDDLSPELVLEMLQTINVFVSANNREIVGSALGYIKVCVVVLDDTIIEPQLPSIVGNLVKCSHQTRNHFKLKIRHIFERLIRRFGYEKISVLVPEDDKKLIANIQKRRLRAKRKKAAAAGTNDESDEEMLEGAARESAKKTGKGFHDAYEEVLYGSESELDDSDDEALQGVKAALAAAANGNTKKKTSKQQQLPGTYIREAEDDTPLDFLDQSALARITSSKPVQRKKQNLAKSVKYDDDGRMVFKEDSDENGNGDSESEAEEDYYMQAQKSADGFVRNEQNKIKFKKGVKNDDFDDAMDVDEGATAKRKKKTKQRFEMVGKEYRSKKASGDVKSKNKADPYAYVPLGKVTKKSRKGPKLTYTGKLKR